MRALTKEEKSAGARIVVINEVEYICYPPVITKEEIRERNRILGEAPPWRGSHEGPDRASAKKEGIILKLKRLFLRSF